MSTAWEDLKHRVSELEALAGVQGVLSWDQQTMMPPGGAAARGRQLALLSAISHEKLVDPALGASLDVLESDADGLDPVQAAAVRNLRWRHTRAGRVPTDLVRALAEAGAAGMGAWVEAKKAGDFKGFEAPLGRIVSLVREAAACHGEAAHPYDNLLEEYDPGSTTADLTPMFDRLGAELSSFVREVADREPPARLDLTLDTDGIRAVGTRVIHQLGFRAANGRLDESEHPFTVGVDPSDVRLTTHSYADDLLGSLTGTIHECGHGLYEQGFPTEYAGTGVASAAGVGLHESQSRFWENVIGRSRPFFGWLVGELSAQWPSHRFDADALYGAANRVEPSLIRIKADEATYNLHILVRYKLECALLADDLQVADLPGAWNDLYAELLGIRPAHDGEGLLQDVHWSHGYFGYFPSYTIGNLYAASFKEAMQADLPGMWDEVAAGEFSSVLGWLREKVHSRGHLVDAPQIFRDAVGDRDPVADLMAHLRSRHGALVGL